jgi:hypothetical protein
MKHILYSLFIFLLSTAAYGQSDSISRHSVGGQILGGALFSIHYEYHLVNQRHFKVHTEFGFGRAEYGDDSTIPVGPSTRVIHFGLVPMFSLWRFKLLASVHPSVYFHGPLTFVDLTGMFGIRYHPQKAAPLFISFHYTPKLYTSLATTQSFYTHFDFGLRVGLSF